MVQKIGYAFGTLTRIWISLINMSSLIILWKKLISYCVIPQRHLSMTLLLSSETIFKERRSWWIHHK